MPRQGPRVRSGDGPVQVVLVVRWQPFPRLLPRLVLRRSWSAATAASFEAALAAARSALEGAAPDGAAPSCAPSPGASGLAPRLQVELRDPRGGVLWRGAHVADVRREARRRAGWLEAPPPPAAAPPARAGTTRPDAPRPGVTPAQRAVIEHPGGAAVVLAVAGAGKTTTMVARVRALVARGTAASSILVTSFSRAAVADLRERLLATAAAADVEVRTFHSLAFAIVHGTLGGGPAPRSARAASGAPGAARPPPDEVVPRLVRIVTDGWRARGRAGAERADELDLAAFSGYRSRCLARLALPAVDAWGIAPALRRAVRPAPEDPEHELHRTLADELEAERLRRGWLDHDALVVHAWLAAAGDDVLRPRLHARWTHVLVDEFQDVNPAQVALLEAVLAPRTEVMAIGDDDQSIYAFRGSDPELLAEFGRRHRARTYVLDDNFRGRPETLAAAGRLALQLGQRAPKRLRAARPPGGRCTLEEVADPGEEAEAVAARVLATRAERPEWSQAVLLRSFGQAPELEEALLRAGVAYRLVGAPSVERRDGTRTALAALHLLARRDAPEAVRARAWRRWLHGVEAAPPGATRLVPRVLAAEALLRARDPATGPPGAAAEPLALAALRGCVGRDGSAGLRPLVRALETVARAAPEGASAALRAARGTIGRWPRTDVDARSLEAVLRCADACVWGDAQASLPAWLDAFASWRARSARAERTVLVTSAHRSKGLEWDVVHVPGQVLGTFPRALDDDERRLAYVAWTRARERLHLYRPWPLVPAPFLAEGGVDELVALQDDLDRMRAAPGRDHGLAGRWARQDALRRLGADPGAPG